MFDVDLDVDMSELEGWELFSEQEKKEALTAAASEAMVLMRERVAKGESLEGGTFKAYDPDYQDRKQRAGRMGENYWLRLSGWMWKTQKVMVRRVGDVMRATITFEGMRPRVKFNAAARQKKGQGKAKLAVNIDRGDMVNSATIAEANDRLRPFIGLTEAERERVVEVIREALAKEKKG